METPKEAIEVRPPKVIPAFIAGFNVVTSHIGLIIVPILLDLFLWLGPHVRVRELLQPFITDMPNLLSQFGADNATAMQSIWVEIVTRYNIFSGLSTLPLGIPSLIAGQAPLITPFGQPSIYELTDSTTAVLLWVLIVAAGLLLASLYFGGLANYTAEQPQPFSMSLAGWQYGQTVLLTVSLVVLLIALTIPISLIISVTLFISPSIAQLVLLVISFMAVWFLVPMMFTPHGIFALRQPIIISLLNSVQMVRFFMSSAGMFLLVALIITQGLSMLWIVPEANSWLTLLGIAGSAFISTSVLASSFIYYRGGIQWMQAALQRIARQMPTTPTNQA